MRHRLALAALVPVVVALGGMGTAQAAPTSGDKPTNHGQCVSSHSQTEGKGGRSAIAKDKGEAGCGCPEQPARPVIAAAEAACCRSAA